MKAKNRFWIYLEKIYLFNQIEKIVQKVEKRCPRLDIPTAYLLVILMGIFWATILFSTISMGVLLTHLPYPGSQIPEECLYESRTDYLIHSDNAVVRISPDGAIHNPTYSELKKFLKEDRTNENEYVVNVYDCTEFSIDVIRNATEKSIRVGKVVLGFPRVGHAIVVFDTADKGLIFIEPMTDEEVKIVFGKNYWQGIIGKNLWRKIENAYSAFDDDVIESISIYWIGTKQS